MILWVEIAKIIVWIIFRKLFMTCRSLSWISTGVYSQLRRNGSKDAYTGTAHVQSIWARHVFDIGQQPSSLNMDFLTTHSSFENPEYILAENVTLYSITEKEATFVEVDRGVDVTKSHVSPFLRAAQFKNARKLIVMPMHAFHKVAEQIGDPKGKLIFLSNTSRCGSTLLTKVFEETGSTITISEPHPMNALSMLQDDTSRDEWELMCKHVINVFCKSHSPHIEAYLVKLRCLTMVLVPDLYKLYPNAYYLFMYRDGLKVAQSLAKFVHVSQLTQLTFALASRSSQFKQELVHNMKSHPVAFNFKLDSPLHASSTIWLITISHYNYFREKGINIVGIRYEDLLENKQRALRTVFRHCGLPHDPHAVERAFSRDSQRFTRVSVNNLSRFQTQEFTRHVRRYTDNLCDYFKVARFPETYIAPGTITGRH